MIIKQKNAQKRYAFGAEFQTLATGEKIMCTIMRHTKNGSIQRHKHPAEQVGYIIKGKIKLFINDEEIGVMEPGDSYIIHGNDFHSMKILEDSEWIDTFSPPREEYKS